MKLRKLTIHNIASIEDAVIDFEAEPLASSEVFLITGKTGAGKSTILDAICLALYANTPRLENTNMQGETKDIGDSVKIYDTRQLMRRNTAEAFVSLTFTGSNEMQYEAVWSVARARKKITGKLQQKSWSLHNLDTDCIFTKVDDIQSEMTSAIGLDFSQFCRTTMLAQGEFTRFLNSKDDEKAAILEKITGVDIYTKIGKKTYEVTTEKKSVYEKAKRLIEDIKILSEEEISSKTAEIAEIEERCGKIKEEHNSADEKILWIRHNAELAEKASAAVENLKAAESAADAPEFKVKEQTVALWNSTVTERGLLNEADRAARQKREAEESLDRLQDNFIEVSSGLQWLKSQTKAKSAEAEELKTFIESESHNSKTYSDVQTILGHLSAIINGRKLIAQESGKISFEQLHLNGELKAGKEKADKALEDADNLCKTQKAICAKLEEDLAAADLPSLRKQKESLLTGISDINIAVDRLKTLSAEKERVRKNSESLAEALKGIETLRSESQKLEQPVHDAKLLMEERRRVLEAQRSSIDDWAKHMRSSLQTGDICPVCRQTIISKLPEEDSLDSLFRLAETDFKESEKTYGDLIEKQNELRSDISSRQLHYNKAKKAFEEDRTLADAEDKAVLACRKCGIELSEENAEELLSAAYKKSITLKEEVEARISAAESIEKKVNESRKEADRLRTEYEKSKEAVLNSEKQISEYRSRITTSQSLVQSKKDEIFAAGNAVREYIKDGEWENDWNESPEEFIKELKDAADAFGKKSVRFADLQASIKENHIIEENLAFSIDAITTSMPCWKMQQETDGHRVSGLQEKVSDLRSKVQSLKELAAAAQRAGKEATDKLNAFLDENKSISADILKSLDNYSPDRIKEMSDSISSAKNNLLSIKTILEQIEGQQKEHLAKKPAFDENETEVFLAGRIAEMDAQSAELQQKKGAICHELRQDADNKIRQKSLLSDAEKKYAEYQKWSRLNQLIGDASGNKFRKIAQSYILSNLIHSANYYMKTLSGRYTLAVEPGTFVISIEDAYQGFVRRAASTISGGESFLVSLSLALALSDIGSRLAVDTLFIDEGFGTLSGEPLQNAVKTLRSLHTKAGRQVGIISHVEELQERIPVQIKVDQEGNNSCSKVTVIS